MASSARDAMTSRERVQATVRGLPVDRVPVMTWLNPHAGCRLMAEFQPAGDARADQLGRSLWQGFSGAGDDPSRDVTDFAPMLHSLYVNREYALELGSDMAFLGVPIDDIGEKVSTDGEPLRIRDAFGCLRGMGHIYLEVLEPAVKSIQELVDYELPDVSKQRPYREIRRFREQNPDACLCGESFGPHDLPSTQIWEMSQFMMALYDYPDEVKRFQARFNDRMIEMSLRTVEAGADVIVIYEDYGTTGRPLISMDMWREFAFPHLKKHVEAIHEAGALAMLHSCGYQMPFLEHYMEAEIDILQSFQPKAGNDFEVAHREYGDRLTFCTGVDIQRGELMTPDELREDILGAYRIGGRNGGHILGYTHMLQYTMPAENIEMILRTVREIQQRLHDA